MKVLSLQDQEILAKKDDYLKKKSSAPRFSSCTNR